MTRLSTLSRRTVASLAAVLLVCALAACSGSGAGATKALPVGQILPAGDRKAVGDVGGSLLTGAKTSLAAYRGKVVVLPFWATWCEPCSVEIPQLDSYYRQVKAQGVDVLGVNTKNPTSNLGKSFVSDNRISFPSLYDPDGTLLLKLAGAAARALPVTVLIDRQGRVAALYSQRVFVQDLKPAIAELAAEKP